MKTWTTATLGDVCDIVNGRNQKEVLDVNGTYPVYGSAGNLMGLANKYICESGTVIIGRKGNISKPLFINEKFWNVDTAFGIYPKNGSLLPKFNYYQCLNIDFASRDKGTTIPSLVKSDLQTIPVSYPPDLSEQQQIVEKLDTAFDLIDRAKANIEKNIQNAKELFQSKLNQVFSEKGEGWEEKKIEEVCESIVAGGDAPKNNFSAERNDKFSIPIYANAVKLNGLYGYTKSPKVTKPSLTIAARGSGTGFTCIRDEPFFPIVRLLVLTPNDKINLRFLKLSVDNQVIKSSGSAIPQFTVPMLKKINLSYPIKLSEQQRIIGEIDQISAQTELLQQKYKQKLANLEELKKSILEKAFKGELI